MGMENNLDYLAGQVLSLVFYIITLVIYNRARKEYIGGKIAAAIKLVMGFLCIRLLADATDYFAGMFLTINADTGRVVKRQQAPQDAPAQSTQGRQLPDPAKAPEARGRGEAVGQVYRTPDGRLIYVEKP